MTARMATWTRSTCWRTRGRAPSPYGCHRLISQVRLYFTIQFEIKTLMFKTPLLHGASVMVLDLFLALTGPVGLQEQVDLRVEVSSGGRGGSCGVKLLTPGIRGDGHIVRLLRLMI